MGHPSNQDFPIHALEFHWQEFEPHLLCYDALENEECEFDLDDVDFSVSEGKRCIGSWDDDGNFRPCPNRAPVTRFAQCDECSKEFFIPDQECLFEPKCHGEKCDWEFCKREHMLYIAFYDTRMKVGMSSSLRIDRRLIEQGADAYSVIGKFPDRLEARETEKEISKRLRIPQFYRQEVLLNNLARPVDKMGIEGRLEGLKITLGEAFQLKPEPLRWLTRYPIELPLRQVPVLQSSPGRHRGKKVGIKGKWMVYESEGLRALNLSDLPARFLARHIA
ncbi:MAG: hypothetical protein A3K76_03845 [Euryarchaeota archaeon RBG_13_57_23]|nr:MAG: hypothetical protein A3K76_03845 [Euryarchaeota archaeon RBG_13_57_23]